ncbi:hypothetical protein [Arthrobacter sp. H5]|uniref:hypothetical protein n=1 Tax=Arthrobacter sp. H5 TaxID=1267973 RepID=UPI00048043A2|nr:hypothetical protein [Arthrobacter sp. H5]
MEQIEAGSGVGSGNAPKLQIQGFQIQRYDGESAVIDLGVETEEGAFDSLPTPLEWEDGDWKLVIPETGNPGIQQ